MKKDLISILDLSKEYIESLFEIARAFKKDPFSKSTALKSKSIALVFEKPSNRTRVSFEVGMVDLGGHAIYLGPDELKLGVRESVKDVGKVLSRYLDGIVARTFSHKDVVELARFSSIPVINGLSDLLHPCQGLSDLFTIKEKFGEEKVKIAFVGDGNNVLNSLLSGCSVLGKHICVATPKGHEPDKGVLKKADLIAKKSNAMIELTNDPVKCVKSADVVYTDVWISMGQESVRSKKITAFKKFQVNKKLLSHANKGAIVMHCLPAHRGEEITDEVLDGKNSVVYDQAENRLHVQKAILLKLLSKKT
ncbi:MAG: ornithine carbamoyltransferase [Candidatus Omnitrophica bacterium]|nr:ornithine carbamoyltransferase [Candidatus Omnitrophota bacterium]